MSTRIQCLLRIADRQSRSGDRTHRSDFFFSKVSIGNYALLLFVFGSLRLPCTHTENFSFALHSQQALNDTSHPDASHRFFGTFACEGDTSPNTPLAGQRYVVFLLVCRQQIG